MGTKPKALIIATMDTKFREALFVKNCLESQEIDPVIMDAGIRGECPVDVEITREQVAHAAGKTLSEIQQIKQEGIALDAMITGATRLANDLLSSEEISGIIGLGGSMGTSLGTSVMRSLPLGFPKVMISTMASRNTRPFVGTKDILMLHSVCDLAGLNRITKAVLYNGALALTGMINGRSTSISMLVPEEKPLIPISTLGTTESCVALLREKLEKQGKEIITFHTVGAGGQAMDELIEQQDVEFVIEISLHELVDHLFGGDYDAGPDRGSASIKKGVPTVFVPGNTDFLVTGPVEMARRRFPARAVHIHNAAITAVRTSTEELVKLAHILAEMCQNATTPVSFVIPLGGFSAFDSSASPLEDKQARYVFRDALKSSLPSRIQVLESHCHINDPEFAKLVLDVMKEMQNGIYADTR